MFFSFHSWFSYQPDADRTDELAPAPDHQQAEPYPPRDYSVERELADAALETHMALGLLATAVCQSGCGPAVWRELQDMAVAIQQRAMQTAIRELESTRNFFGKGEA